ncbi:copper resistance CopC family protein [Actinokineospora sp. NBRC 105648]|uniref:copper resistance CopC family protein n=1 Tax=Actinokineospora sp. NBRC 105648 TaxID=3032206 RepID=UPI0024A16BE5|nr:copper resistance CopC family protein [Actinokineospora sp. NBRC 105648]GLZ36496.1 hypothetical protein Acsp05_01210 [Actinokineospora sp. NBRC 105648]
MILRRLAAILLLAGVALTATALPASAHVELESSSPAKGAALAELPQSVQLTFTEAVTIGPNDSVSVSGAGGRWTVERPVVAGTVVTVAVQPVGLAGQYAIEYRVTSDDGHTVSGQIPFSTIVDAPGAQTTSSETAGSDVVTSEELPPVTEVSTAPVAAPAPGSNAMPNWVWITGLAVLVAIGALLALRRSGKQ